MNDRLKVKVLNKNIIPENKSINRDNEYKREDKVVVSCVLWVRRKGRTQVIKNSKQI